MVPMCTLCVLQGFQRPSFGSGGAAASPTPQHSGASPAAPAPAPQQPQHAAPPPSGMAPSWSAPAPEPYHVPMTYAEVDGTSAGSGAAASGGQQQPQQPRWQHAAAAAAPGRQPLASVSPLGGQQQGPPFRQQTTPGNTATVGSSPVGGRPGCVAVSSDPFDMSAQAPPLNAEAGQQKHSAAFHALYGGGPAALDGGGAPQPAVSPAQQSSDPFQPGGGSAAGGQSQHGHHGFGGQPIYGRHPAEPSGDDPFQPGGAARGGGASVQYPGGIYGAQAAPSPAGGHGGGVWQPAYGNVPPAASAAGAGGGAEPKSYEKAYQQYLAQHPGGAGQAQGISGDTGPPSRPAHPPGGYADSPASVGYSGQQQGHQQQPQQSQQHQQLQQHPRPPQSQGTGIAAASGGAGEYLLRLLWLEIASCSHDLLFPNDCTNRVRRVSRSPRQTPAAKQQCAKGRRVIKRTVMCRSGTAWGLSRAACCSFVVAAVCMGCRPCWHQAAASR